MLEEGVMMQGGVVVVGMPGRRRVPPCGQPGVRPPLPAPTRTTYCPKSPYIRRQEKKMPPSGEGGGREGRRLHCGDGIEAEPGCQEDSHCRVPATVRCQSIYIVPPHLRWDSRTEGGTS